MSSKPEKTCGHVHGCLLDLPDCCSCADLRPSTALTEVDDGMEAIADTVLYHVYVDGVGMTKGDRWAWYCEPCKAIHRPRPEPGPLPIEPARGEARRRRAEVATRFQRIFGSREEIEDTAYESPITSMFTRAWNRYREHQSIQPRPDTRIDPGDAELELVQEQFAEMQIRHGRGRRQEGDDMAVHAFSRENSPAPLPDVDLSAFLSSPRPAPLPAEQLVNVECKVCFSFVADVLVLPCSHLVLCSYCAPILKLDGPRAQRRDKCVLCRSKVTRTLKVFR